jgi:hypothetical protein
LKPEQQTAGELIAIRTLLEPMTGLTSRWNGKVVLVEAAEYRGLKPFHCSIYLRADLAGEPARWRTLIHESLHALSAGYNFADYQRYRGWEEGVVENCQRLLRPAVLEKLNVSVEESIFTEIEAANDFNRDIAALENVRLALGSSDRLAFYLYLLRTPLKDRYASLLAQAMPEHGVTRAEALRALSEAHAILTTRLR